MTERDAPAHPARSSCDSAPWRGRQRWWRRADGMAGRRSSPSSERFSRINDWVGEKFLSHAPAGARNTRFRPEPRWTIPGLLHHLQSDRVVSGGDICRTGRWRWAAWCETAAAHACRTLETLPGLTYTVKHHCVEGWTAVGTWTGVPLSDGGRDGAAEARGAVSPVRLVRQRLLQRLGPHQRHASSDHPGLRLERPAPDDESRRSAPAVLSGQAGLQADEVSDRNDLYPGSARRLLGRPGLSLARRNLARDPRPRPTLSAAPSGR